MVRELWHVINTVHISKWNIPASQVNFFFFLFFFLPESAVDSTFVLAMEMID